MSPRMASLLADLASQAGLPEDAVTGPLPIQLIFDGNTGVNVAEDEVTGEIFLSSKLAELADESDMAAVSLMIGRANYEQDELHGAFLAMSEQGSVILSRRMSLQSLDYAALERLLADFVEFAERWTDHTASLIEALHSRERPMGEHPELKV